MPCKVEVMVNKPQHDNDKNTLDFNKGNGCIQLLPYGLKGRPRAIALIFWMCTCVKKKKDERNLNLLDIVLFTYNW